MSSLRRPAVAGQFYPADPEKLKKEIERCLSLKLTPGKKAVGVVLPHAGYIYSGRVAGEVLGQIEIPKKIVILSPNHTGYGLPCSMMTRGKWETPLGKALIDEELADHFLKNCPLLQEDEEAHRLEHSLEVQIPFLQYLRNDFRFVPLTLSHLPFEACRQTGIALAKTIRETGESVLMIASSDMNHYENQETTLKKDQLAIDQILALDPEGLYETVRKNGVSMCGIIPATVMLVASCELGAKKAELVRHATSGDVTGDYGSVVGYAGLIVS